MSKTAFRRHHHERIVNKRLQHGHWLGYREPEQRPDGWRNRLDRTPRPCSCLGCKNGWPELQAFKVHRLDTSDGECA